jgi:hypothetical protein
MPTRLPRSAQHADACGGEHEVSAVNLFRPSQRAANTLRKCPLEQISTLPFTARIRSTLRSALAATCSGDSPPPDSRRRKVSRRACLSESRLGAALRIFRSPIRRDRRRPALPLRSLPVHRFYLPSGAGWSGPPGTVVYSDAHPGDLLAALRVPSGRDPSGRCVDRSETMQSPCLARQLS